MARIRLVLDPETAARLTEIAAAARRPVAWQAEVLLRRALGLAPSDADHGDRPDGQTGGEARAGVDDGVG